MLDPCLVGSNSVSERHFDSMVYISDVHASHRWSTRPLVRRFSATGHWGIELTFLRRGRKAPGGLVSGIVCAASAPAHLKASKHVPSCPSRIPQQMSCLEHRATCWHPIRETWTRFSVPSRIFSLFRFFGDGRTIIISAD